MFPLDVFISNSITLFRIYRNSRTPDILLHFHSSTKRPRNARPRKNYPRENGCVPQITLEGLLWVEGLYEEFVLRALSSLGEIIFAW